ncbi:MAG: transglycosylase domain-containing protein [Treponema sp.]|jgi:penicillin-binding protein 1C|nr:transglycosylase domain-containing protein [Treponema sp.]
MGATQGKLKFLFQKRKLIFALICFVILFYLFLLILPFPELDAFRGRSWGTVISDRNGTVLRVLPATDGVKREWASLGEIPAGAVKIFVRSEDRRFYFHPGVDIIAIGRSFLRNAQEQRVVSGASTITMQLARMINPHSGGLGGKIREAWDAIRLEVKLSKKEILELWLNSIPFGSNIEGLPAMTRSRFGRPISQLDDNRAALLAAVPRRPGFYDPAVNSDAAVSTALALSEISGLGLREDELLNAAKEAAAVSQGTEDPRAPFFAPHFTERMRLSDVHDKSYVLSDTKIRSTLDLGFQRYAEELLALELSLVSRNRVSNGAILAIENDTGAVRVYVGSASWFNDAVSGKIDGVRFRGQPGSCLKPFLYALAIDAGFGPADIMPDLPTVFGTREAYIPMNFNNRFNGPVRLRIALASSLNIPAVYLLERVGVNTFEEYLVSLGFESIRETMGTHGTGLALGNAEVSLEEMVRGFSAFPRGGSPAELIWIEGDKTPQPAGLSQQFMSPYVAWIIADILSDRSSRFVGFGPAPALVTPFVSMFKTGTANQFQHIWALGATKRFTVGVWMGNFSGETVIGSTGSSIPASIATRLLTAMEQSAGAGDRGSAGSFENLAGPTPAGVTETQICALSGMASGPYCTGLTREWIRNEKTPSTCTWHTEAGLFYPLEYQAWLAERFRSGSVMQGGSGRIRNPVSGSVYYLDPSIPPNAQALRVETNGFSADALVYSDGVLQGSLNHAGVYALPLSRGRHTVLVEDIDGSSAMVDFEVR